MRSHLVLLFLVMFFTQSAISQHEKTISLVDSTKTMNLDMWDLADYAKNNIKDKEELAYFFYYWIGSNVKYDHGTFDKIIAGTMSYEEFDKLQDPFWVYDDKTGVCAGYARLYQWFMNEVEIEVEFVIGYIRDERNHYVELEKDADFGHAWNAIKVDGRWMLVDSTWGASNNFEVSDYYFDIIPERAILTHYPEDSKWQLLAKPLSLEEFNKSKFINAIWFKVGFSDNPKLKKDADYYYFVFKTNPDKSWKVDLKVSEDNINFTSINSFENEVIEQDGYTYLRFSKTILPKLKYFKVNLEVTSGENVWSIAYNDVINFKI